MMCCTRQELVGRPPDEIKNNELGHMKKDCPRLKKNKVMQQVEETSGDDGTSTGVSWSG